MSFDINELNPHDNVHSECDLEIYQLKQENARLREALEVYADEKNWESEHGYSRTKKWLFVRFIENRYEEGFELAQKVLEQTK